MSGAAPPAHAADGGRALWHHAAPRPPRLMCGRLAATTPSAQPAPPHAYRPSRPQATPWEPSSKTTICDNSAGGSASISNRLADGFIPSVTRLLDLIPDRLYIITEAIEVSGSQAVDEGSRGGCPNALRAEDLLAGHRIESVERDTRNRFNGLHARATDPLHDLDSNAVYFDPWCVSPYSSV